MDSQALFFLVGGQVGEAHGDDVEGVSTLGEVSAEVSGDGAGTAADGREFVVEHKDFHGAIIACGRGHGLFENRGSSQVHFSESVLEGDGEAAEAVAAASREVDGGGLWEVFGGAGDFGDLVALVEDLCEHLIVEDEVVGVFFEGDFLEQFA